MEKKNKFIEYKKDIIHAIDNSMLFIKENNDRASCGILLYHLDCCIAHYDFNKDILAKYRKVCRARRESLGFRCYTDEQWMYKSQKEQQEIRIKNLEKFKKYIEETY